MKTLKFYEQTGLLIRYYLHFIIFNRWHFQIHYRNDFPPSDKEILDEVSEKLVECMRNTTLSLE